MTGTPIGLLCGALIRKRLEQQGWIKALSLTSTCLVVSGTVLFASVGGSREPFALYVEIIAGFISASGVAFLTIFWGMRFTRLTTQEIETYALYSLLVSFICYAVALILPRILGVFFITALPCLSFLCLLKADQTPSEAFRATSSDMATSTAIDESSKNIPRPSMGRFALIGLGMTAITFSVSAFWGLIQASALNLPLSLFRVSLLSGTITTLVLVLTITRFARTLSPVAFYRVICPLIAIGFVLTALGEMPLVFIASLLIFAAQTALNVLTFIFFTEYSQRTSQSPALVFGVGRSFVEFGFLVGTVISQWLAEALSGSLSRIPIVMIIILTVLFLIITLTVADPERFNFDDSLLKAPSPACLDEQGFDTLFRSHIDTLAEGCGLTQREREIFFYLAKGYSLPYIRNELYISQSTIDTHAKHIYAKLDIHSRAELLNLVSNGVQNFAHTSSKTIF
jgi:DNA-binding CsgD family transcriptional regulator